MPIVDHDHRVPALGHYQVLIPVIVEVDQQGAAADFHPINASRCGNIAQGSVGALHIQSIRQSALLRDKDIIEPITVDIADGDTLITVWINAVIRLQTAPPMVDSAAELLAK